MSGKRGEMCKHSWRGKKFISRDNARTPFQWDNSRNAGFTKGRPWIKVNPDFVAFNQAAEEKDPNSVLNYFRKIVRLRKQLPELVYGKYELFDRNNEKVYGYTRTFENKKVLVLLNFSKTATTFSIPATTGRPGTVLINNLRDFHVTITPNQNSFRLQPYQAVVIRLE